MIPETKRDESAGLDPEGGGDGPPLTLIIDL